MSQSGTYELIFPQRSGSLEEENAKVQSRKGARKTENLRQVQVGHWRDGASA